MEVPAPVTVAEKDPADAELTDRVVVTTLSGGRNKPASRVDAVSVPVVVRVMKSVKPPKLVKVMVEVPVTPTPISSEAGLAVIAKSVWLEKLALTRLSMSGILVPLPIVTWIRLMGVPGESDMVL